MAKQLTAKQIDIIKKALQKYIIEDNSDTFTALMNAIEGNVKIIVEPDEYKEVFILKIALDDKKGFTYEYSLELPFNRILPSVPGQKIDVKLKHICKEFLYRFSNGLSIKLAGAYSMNREMLRGL